MRTVDVIVIGGGHNGLTLAAYLAHAGVDVLVLERRAEFGGGLCTEEVTLPGFQHNLHSNFHGAMPFFPPFGDFKLEDRGAIYLHPPANTGMPMKDGRALVLYTDELRSYEELARFSPRDAEAWLELRGQMMSHVEELLGSGYSPPIDDPDAEPYLAKELDGWFKQGVTAMSAVELVRSRFENPHVQALLLFHMAVGGWDVREPGLAPLGIAFLAYITNWQLCRGGSHHLAHLLGGVLLEAGGDLREDCEVARIMVEGGRATGVVLSTGEKILARKAVVSTVDPHQTFRTMIDEGALPPGMPARVDAITYGHGDVLFGVHLALDEAPRYTAAKGNPDIDRTFNINIGYERPEDLIEHYAEIDRKALPKVPRLQVGVNTLFDPSQAPPGKHTALLWQFVPYEPDGKDPSTWNQIKHEYAERCIAAWREYAPNITGDKILGSYAYSPYDTSRKLINMRRGGFHCAAVLQKQAIYRRPVKDVGTMRTPIEGLYVGGSSCHPHGGITAGPGYNCFQLLVDDLKLKTPHVGNKFWEPVRDQWRARMRSMGFRV
ncbi:MAG: NAD(P)/FAD-dependent oxidoreductase [Deltaproteobacteria bacterium]|nr:NAD(P)/FAD-dependent oxidoreductase [Deltaproteobacteria bacterium]